MVITGDVIFISGTTGERIRLSRLARRWTQAELAVFATAAFQDVYPDRKVTPSDVGYVERGWRIFQGKQKAILAVLGLEDDRR